MKKNLQNVMCALSVAFTTMSYAQTTVTGPSSTQTPYLIPSTPNTTIVSIFTASQTVGTYTMAGLMDGVGAYDNGDGTFTALINHEIGNTSGSPRAHGSQGAFVSKTIINKSTLSVVSASDLIQNVNIWNGTGYTTYNASNTSTLAAFNRFCSADLPPVSAFYHAGSGTGTQEKIFMNGEEAGNEGRFFAHIATGPNAGTSYELPYLGNLSGENALACPFSGTKTVVGLLDDQTPGQVYFYIGSKTNTGNEITRAGLTGGNLYGVAVTGLTAEVSASVPSANTTFSLINLGDVSGLTGATINTNSNGAGITTFLRPEDGAWDPSTPTDFYFATTNAFGSPSRLWRLRFTNITTPELGGTITAVLDGTEGQQMLDNLGIDGSGHILLQEDPGNQAHNAKIWEYNIATDVLTQLASHDPARFITGGGSFLTQDEESSGMIDMGSILGQGWFLFVDQAHYSIPAPVVEGGQLLALYKPSLATGIIINPKQENTFDLYPNPANNSITFSYSLSNSKNGIVKIIDIEGRLIFETSFNTSENTFTLNTADFNNGVYTIEVITETFISKKKLVLTH